MYSITFDMSRGIVSQKKFSRKKRKQSFRKMLNRSGVSVPEFKISQKLKNILSRWLFFALVIIGGIYISIKSLFFKPEQTISQIKFSDDTLATYQDIELFNLISHEVKWENYYVLLSNKDELLKNIQKKFPFVWAIELQLEQQEIEVFTGDEKIITWIKFPVTIQWTWNENTQNDSTGTDMQIVENNFPLKPLILGELKLFVKLRQNTVIPKIEIKSK